MNDIPFETCKQISNHLFLRDLLQFKSVSLYYYNNLKDIFKNLVEQIAYPHVKHIKLPYEIIALYILILGRNIKNLVNYDNIAYRKIYRNLLFSHDFNDRKVVRGKTRLAVEDLRSLIVHTMSKIYPPYNHISSKVLLHIKNTKINLHIEIMYWIDYIPYFKANYVPENSLSDVNSLLKELHGDNCCAINKYELFGVNREIYMKKLEQKILILSSVGFF